MRAGLVAKLCLEPTSKNERPSGGSSLLVLLVAATISCGGGFFRQYEYEEDMYLSLDGSATIYVNSSVAALNALRGASFDPRPNAPLDRGAIRAYFTTPVTRVTSVGRPSRRTNRQFVHVRVEVDNVRRLREAAPFAWSSYQFSNEGDKVAFRQTVGGSAGRPVDEAGWSGEEIVAFRLHVPSKIEDQNAGAGNPRRGNILVWEQPLTDRLRSVPLTLDVRMQPQSILYRTLRLFLATALAVAAMFTAIIWWMLCRSASDRSHGGEAGQRLRPCRAVAVGSHGSASASVRAGGGAPAPLKKED